MAKAVFMVRAELADTADRQKFYGWYETEHLPDAVRTFGAECAWRGWGDQAPAAHYAFYQFPDVSSAKAAIASDGMRRLIADFDRAWGARVRRSRDILEVVQRLEGQSGQ